MSGIVHGGNLATARALYGEPAGGWLDLSTGINPGTTFSWSFGDGTSSSTRFPQHLYTTPGTYNVCLSIADSSAVPSRLTAKKSTGRRALIRPAAWTTASAPSTISSWSSSTSTRR